MSIILGVIVNDLEGNKEMILASDGRVLEHGTKNIRNEDLDKVKSLSSKICIGYCGHSGELFKDVVNNLKKKMKNMMVKDLLFVTSKLRITIFEMLETKRHQAIEEHFGPLNHQFIIGGLYNRKLRFNTLLSNNKFKINKSELQSSKNIHIEIMGSTYEVHHRIKTISKKMLGQPQSFEKIVHNIRYIISKIAETNHEINNHIFIRRISRNFELESYIGYK